MLIIKKVIDEKIYYLFYTIILNYIKSIDKLEVTIFLKHNHKTNKKHHKMDIINMYLEKYKWRFIKMNEYINLTLENIDNEHICCAIGDKKHQAGVEAKKEWLKDKLSNGHVFRKLNARGKTFIEYEPLSSAWVPVNGANYLYILFMGSRII